jgi:allantoate deiminase
MGKELQRAEKIVSRINELAAVSEAGDGITRRYGTEAFLEGANKVLQWMQEAGLRVRVDHIGNVRGVWRSDDPAAKTLVIASHIDTVQDAGRWDGPLGVLTGLDLLEDIIQSKKKLPFHIELIAFCDEEGVRFHTTYLGSKVVAGSFDRELLFRKDEEGISLEEVIHKIGGETSELEEDAIVPGEWLGYFEIHIEQGPVLYERKIPAAFVTAIAGQVRAEVVFKGVAGHAGTVPMDLRNDALCGSSEFILGLEKLALASAHELVATVGKLQIRHAASNVIPGEVLCSVDIRSPDEEVLSRSHERIRELSEQVGRQRKLGVEWEVLQVSRPVVCDAWMNGLLAQSIKGTGYEPLGLVSGAGHDAVPISAVSPVAMLFVRCFKGISHHPLENVETADIAAVIAISDNFIHQLTVAWKYQL